MSGLIATLEWIHGIRPTSTVSKSGRNSEQDIRAELRQAFEYQRAAHNDQAASGAPGQAAHPTTSDSSGSAATKVYL